MEKQIDQSPNKPVLTGLTKDQIGEILSSFNQPSFRAEQLHHWIYIKSCKDFDSMTNVSKDLKIILKDQTILYPSQILQKQVSEDGTIKYLIEYPDKKKVETVLMKFDNRPNLTACLSSQIGCNVKCVFCATGKIDFQRNLTHSEIVDQVLTIQRDSGLKVTNIVFMGQGEPLFNYTNLYNSIKLLNESMRISTRRMTVSTSGVIPKIIQLAKDFPQVTLALSLHASNSELRRKLVPLEKTFPLHDLITCLKEYYSITNNRITIEYVLIKGINDSLEQAKQMNILLKDIHCNINLIPFNKIDKNSEYDSPSQDRIKMFKYILELSGKKVTVRLKRGKDIDAACGQLSGRYYND